MDILATFGLASSPPSSSNIAIALSSILSVLWQLLESVVLGSSYFYTRSARIKASIEPGFLMIPLTCLATTFAIAINNAILSAQKQFELGHGVTQSSYLRCVPGAMCDPE